MKLPFKIPFNFPVKNKPFAVNGQRAFRITAAVIIAFGLTFIGSGFGIAQAGKTIRKQYEGAGGKLVRMFSERDRRIYNRVQAIMILGRITQSTGLGIILFGIAVIIDPSFLLILLRQIGIDMEPPLNADSQLRGPPQ